MWDRALWQGSEGTSFGRWWEGYCCQASCGRVPPTRPVILLVMCSVSCCCCFTGANCAVALFFVM